VANQIKWGGRSTSTTLASTELNSLTNGGTPALGAEYDNATNLYRWVDIEVVLASFTPTAGGYVGIYMAPALDGTNYPDTKMEHVHELVATLGLYAGAGAVRTTVCGIRVPPSKFKLLVYNAAGANFASSGNTITGWFYNEEVQ